ncbi:uncharacterized protein LOC143883240 [Tasmannia lanceolata]|uniref:uncharacterized protein LOC143883240 n=1 Tax=Tasmannia lanceolata TaxID=3420 RepID=UPI004063EADA
MDISSDRLEPVDWSIFGFSGGEVKVRGKIKLPVTFGAHLIQRTIMQTFVIVRVPSTYNGIIERPALNELGAVVSTAHLKIKFPTKLGVGEVIGDQEKARECYAALLKKKNTAKETFFICGTDPRVEVKQGEPVEELTKIPLFPGADKQIVQIGSLLSGKLKTDLVNFLKTNLDIFAWSASDMQGIPSNVAIHKLNVDPNSKPVKQKKRNFAVERQKHIKEEVDKLFDAKFNREIHYPEWLANVVMVRKSNGKWRICIDFTDLNKACPKDCYPLPRIDHLIDATIGHEMLSFMDAFSGYNLIQTYGTDRGIRRTKSPSRRTDSDPTEPRSTVDVVRGRLLQRRGNGAGLVITGPDNFIAEYAL